jgi:hypothetical protein
MVNNLTLSPAGLALLDMLEQQTGVSFEVVHLWLDSVRLPPGGESAVRAKEPLVAEEVSKALRTGEVRLGCVQGVTFGVFPLRRAREIIGCLIASRRDSPGQSPATGDRLEEAGALGRGILESDILVSGQLVAAEAVTRRLHSILRFVGQLGTYETDRDVMHAVLHAATVWFDLDCRIYERRLDGRFVLSGALPGVGRPGTGQLLEADRAAHLVAARRFSSAGDMDDLGLAHRRAEVLVLPVGSAEPAWLILLAGTLDSYAELTFAAIARVLTGDLQARELARIEGWQRRFLQLPAGVRATSGRAVEQMLTELVTDAGASGARLTIVEATGERHDRAHVGDSRPEEKSREEIEQRLAESRHLQMTVQLSQEAAVQLDLWSTKPFEPAAQRLAQAWVKALLPWIADLATHWIGARG